MGQQIFDQRDPHSSIVTLTDLAEGANLAFYKMHLHQATGMEYRDYWLKGTTEANIRKVRERDARKFRRIVERFPYDWPMHEQGAYVLRAFSGLQLFPDANHRTGLVISRAHLGLNGYSLRARTQEVTDLVQNIRNPKSPLYAKCKTDQLALRNPTFIYVAEFYRTHVHQVSTMQALSNWVRRLLGPQSKSVSNDLLAWDEDESQERARKLEVAQQVER